ncbi:MAG: DUF4416 family protein [Thermodesulfobacteriota bacterium]
MSRLRDPDPVKPVVSVFSARLELIKQSAVRLEELLGPLDFAGPVLVFDQTEYYREEMGWPLFKRLLGAERLVDPGELAGIKIQALRIEEEFSREGRRAVNLDPGYLAMDKLVLATGKSAAHRIYLDRGVWADLTLIYRSGGFKDLPWTYPDYRAPETLTALAGIRKKYLEQLRRKKRGESGT